jgi:hypothetical protein
MKLRAIGEKSLQDCDGSVIAGFSTRPSSPSYCGHDHQIGVLKELLALARNSIRGRVIGCSL